MIWYSSFDVCLASQDMRTQSLASSSQSGHDQISDMALVLVEGNGFRTFYGIKLVSLINDMVQRCILFTLIYDGCFAGDVGRDGDRECTTFRAFF